MTGVSSGRSGRSRHPQNAFGEAQLLECIPRLENRRETTKPSENLEPRTRNARRRLEAARAGMAVARQSASVAPGSNQ
eukprot:1931710-Pyramimonas_sp.AAC.1